MSDVNHSIAMLRVLAAIEKVTLLIERHGEFMSEGEGAHLKVTLGHLVDQASRLEHIEGVDKSLPGVEDALRTQQAAASAMCRLVDEVVSASDPSIPLIFEPQEGHSAGERLHSVVMADLVVLVESVSHLVDSHAETLEESELRGLRDSIGTLARQAEMIGYAELHPESPVAALLPDLYRQAMQMTSLFEETVAATFVGAVFSKHLNANLG